MRYKLVTKSLDLDGDVIVEIPKGSLDVRVTDSYESVRDSEPPSYLVHPIVKIRYLEPLKN